MHNFTESSLTLIYLRRLICLDYLLLITRQVSSKVLNLSPIFDLNRIFALHKVALHITVMRCIKVSDFLVSIFFMKVELPWGSQSWQEGWCWYFQISCWQQTCSLRYGQVQKPVNDWDNDRGWVCFTILHRFFFNRSKDVIENGVSVEVLIK